MLGNRAITLNEKSQAALAFIQRLPINASNNQYLLYATIEKDYIVHKLLYDDMLLSSKATLSDDSGNLILSHGDVRSKKFAAISHTSAGYGLTATVQVDSFVYEGSLSRCAT
ncbi:MAG: hypothetical protein ACOX8S_06590 [Christensenellales bacterium]